MASTVTAVPESTPTQSNNGNGPTSSPLLFFVALGFGVVFTNLWIIVGVKYCFRYNARQRARQNGDEDAVDLQAVPRPHRRRREKKLMTIDEVNERFPITNYKGWRAQREAAGLPSEGGIRTEPNSRAASIRSIEPIEPVETSGVEPKPSTSKEVEVGAAASDAISLKEKRLSDISEKKPSPTEHGNSHDDDHDNDHDDEENLHPVDSDLLKSSGDTCAICLDILEDDDDIRGLTCGHAFHAACLDPWLTSRRACCPLCKTDYYIPKPRPAEEATPTMQTTPTPSQPEFVVRRPFFTQGRFNARLDRRVMGETHRIRPPRRRSTDPNSGTDQQQPQQTQEGGSVWAWRNRLQGISIPRPAFLSGMGRRTERATDDTTAPPDVEAQRSAMTTTTTTTAAAV